MYIHYREPNFIGIGPGVCRMSLLMESDLSIFLGTNTLQSYSHKVRTWNFKLKSDWTVLFNNIKNRKTGLQEIT